MKRNNVLVFPRNRLDEYFLSYRREAKRRGWPIGHKADLYAKGEVAFLSSRPRRERRDAFQRIYEALRGPWQAFRNGKGVSADEAFGLLDSRSLQECHRNRLSLSTLRPADARCVWACLLAVAPIKANRSGMVSPVPVSKFLHFARPALFPIYDMEVVESDVRRNYDLSGENDKQLERLEEWSRHEHDRLRRYLRFILWSAKQVQGIGRQALMTSFVRHFQAALDEEKHPRVDKRVVSGLVAAAIEFIVIGRQHADH
jgi:hypothetical protein